MGRPKGHNNRATFESGFHRSVRADINLGIVIVDDGDVLGPRQPFSRMVKITNPYRYDSPPLAAIAEDGRAPSSIASLQATSGTRPQPASRTHTLKLAPEIEHGQCLWWSI